jgi:DHA1 family bicyclomycin/chloramphenicol resistance-like MFS transporter
MPPHAATSWRGPRWALAALLAALSTLGPFSIDTYLPGFDAIAASLQATPLQMQQTLSAYLAGFALMNLFHGALADSVGRRPVVLVGLAVFAAASVGCALAPSISMLVACRAAQGLAAGAGMVVARAIVRDLFAPDDAQRVMSQVTIYFGVAPAVAPIIGGWLLVHAGWRSIFAFLAVVGALLWLLNWRALPETLRPADRQRFDARNLLRGYAGMARDGRFLLLVVASGIPFNGMFLYVLSAPVFLGRHLGLAPTQFFWLFLVAIGGIMAGAWWSGRLAGRLPRPRQVRRGFVIMGLAAVVNLALNLSGPPPVPLALAPIGVYAFGWALMVPVVTLMVLDRFPRRRGMAASMHASIGSVANAVIAGAVAPLVMVSTRSLALSALALMAIGLVAWTALRPADLLADLPTDLPAPAPPTD